MSAFFGLAVRNLAAAIRRRAFDASKQPQRFDFTNSVLQTAQERSPDSKSNLTLTLDRHAGDDQTAADEREIADLSRIVEADPLDDPGIGWRREED